MGHITNWEGGGFGSPTAKVKDRRIDHPDLRNTLREGLVWLEKI